MKIDDHKTKEN